MANSQRGDDVEIICPSAEELSLGYQTDIPCPIAWCGRVFPQSSALRFHMIKVHRIIETPADQRLSKRQKSALSQRFHCPVDDCQYRSGGDKYFATYKYLKQHFMKLHAPKNFVCPACSAVFGLKYDLNRHVAKHHNTVQESTVEPSHVHAETSYSRLDDFSVDTQFSTAAPAVNVNVANDNSNVIDSEKFFINLKFSEENQSSTINRTSTNTPAVAAGKETTVAAAGADAVSLAVDVSCKNGTPEIRTVKIGDVSYTISVSLTAGSADSDANRLSGKRRRKSSQNPSTFSKKKSLLPKPSAFLIPALPVYVVSDPSDAQLCENRQALVPIKPAALSGIVDESLESRGDATSPLKTVVVSKVDSLSQTDDSAVQAPHLGDRSSRIMVEASCGLHTRTASTQTVVATTFDRTSLPPKASQVHSRGTGRRYRAIQHSHTQTYGTLRKPENSAVFLSQNALNNAPSLPPNMAQFDSTWSDRVSNATQTFDSTTTQFVESILTQTTESFLNELSSRTDVLLDQPNWYNAADLAPMDPTGGVYHDVSGLGLAVENTCSNAAVHSSANSATLLLDSSVHEAVNGVMHQADGNRVCEVHHVTGSIAVPDKVNSVNDDFVDRQSCNNNINGSEVFHSTRDMSVQFDEILDSLWNASDTLQVSNHTLTSASQTVAVDFDAVSTQTMDCDFVCSTDFDFSNTQTQTNDDMFDEDDYFGFADIETQTAGDLFLWDSQTQTCFETLLSESERQT